MLKIKRPNQMTARKPHVYCKGYIPLLESSVMMLYSPGGVGKSFAAIKTAAEFALDTGKPVALWLTEDSEGENRDRYERTIAEYDKPREFFDNLIHFIEESPRRITEQYHGNARLTDDFYEVRLALFDYRLVVLDPLLQFSGGEENNNTHAGVFMGAMKDWAAEEQKVILLLHHATKVTGQDKRVSIKPRGAGEFVNGTRGVYEIRRCTKSDGTFDEDKNDYRVVTLVKDNGMSYFFRDPYTDETTRELKVFPPRRQVEEMRCYGDEVIMSVADHNSEKNAKGFKPVTIPFSQIHLLAMSGKAYSPYTFLDGHRKNENNLGSAHVLCLDFDGEMPLETAKEKFKSVRSCLVTTRSHGKKGDRFRIFIKLKSPLTVPEYDHNDFMQELFDHIGAVDPATKDLARFFFSSPEDAVVHYSLSAKDFDWEPIYSRVKKNKVLSEINRRRTGRDFKNNASIKRTEQDNTLPADTQFIGKRGESYTFGGLRDTLSYGQKVVVQCRKGHGHNGGKGAHHNPAAFVAKADNGNVFYHCSGAKCALDGALWCEE